MRHAQKLERIYIHFDQKVRSPQLLRLNRSPKHEIKGSLLEREFANCEAHFKHVLFGVCAGVMESYYLLVLSQKHVNEAEYAELAHEMETACAKSNVCPTYL